MDSSENFLIRYTDRGIYCPAGGFYIDPTRAVKKAVITHAHSDHARAGSHAYLCSHSCKELLALRVQKGAAIQSIAFGEETRIGDVTVSLHPAGHILGSSQVRIEHRGRVCVVSGDYKLQSDKSCEDFEPVRCDHFVTEATFALPVYHWPSEEKIFSEIHHWWRENRQRGVTSIIYAYSLGKAQRILSGLNRDAGPIGVHGSVLQFLAPYKKHGIILPEVLSANSLNSAALKGKGLVVVPPASANREWLQKLSPYTDAFASGWMQVRARKRYRNVDRGFVVSDHVDWQGILDAVEATGAEHITATHGDSAVLIRYLNERGFRADALESASWNVTEVR